MTDIPVSEAVEREVGINDAIRQFSIGVPYEKRHRTDWFTVRRYPAGQGWPEFDTTPTGKPRRFRSAPAAKARAAILNATLNGAS